MYVYLHVYLPLNRHQWSRLHNIRSLPPVGNTPVYEAERTPVTNPEQSTSFPGCTRQSHRSGHSLSETQLMLL